MSADGAYLAPRGLVILANFSDVKFKAENTQAAFDSLMNVKGYTYHGVSNSVRDYFIDQSHGKYTPEFDVYGPVTVNHTMKYYGENDADGYDKNAEQLIKDACNAAKEAYNIDFTKKLESTPRTEPKIILGDVAAKVLEVIPFDKFITDEEILDKVEEIAPSELPSIILELEMKGYVTEDAGRYKRKVGG